MTRVLIIRHPETLANAQRRLLGRSDSPWTEHGLVQARALKTIVENAGPDAVWTSPLPRALKAADLATPCTVPLRIVEELQEIDFGRADGLTFEEVEQARLRLRYRPSTGDQAAHDGLPDTKCAEIAPGGEDWGAFRARVESICGAVREELGTVCAFTHGGTGRALLARLLGLPIDAMWSFTLPPAGIAEVRIDYGAGVLDRLWNPSV